MSWSFHFLLPLWPWLKVKVTEPHIKLFLSFKHVSHWIAILSVIYALHCPRFSLQVTLCALHNESYFRKSKVTKKETKCQALTSLYFKTSVEGRNMNPGWQELTVLDDRVSVQHTQNSCSTTFVTSKVVIDLSSQCLFTYICTVNCMANLRFMFVCERARACMYVCAHTRVCICVCVYMLPSLSLSPPQQHSWKLCAVNG